MDVVSGLTQTGVSMVANSYMRTSRWTGAGPRVIIRVKIFALGLSSP